jgi:hypothetical protein
VLHPHAARCPLCYITAYYSIVVLYNDDVYMYVCACVTTACCRHNIKSWDVMFCGPRPLKVALEETCRRSPPLPPHLAPFANTFTFYFLRNKTTTRATFNFHGENF